MATAYAALLSLINTISMERTPRPSHSSMPFDEPLIDALLERVGFLVEFLEQGWMGSQHLDPRIADLAYAAEDAIESSIVHQILATSTSSFDEPKSPIPCLTLETIIQGMDSIKAEVMHIRVNIGLKDLHLQSQINVNGASTAGPRSKKPKMVGFEDENIRIMEELVGKQSRSRQIIPIVGMGGIGKTTLARNIFDDGLILQYFDFRAWVTISQDYNVKNILSEVVKEQGDDGADEESLGQKVYQYLFGRRYLIVLDDMWSIDAWNKIRRFFPDNQNGSGIIVTTRLSNLAEELNTCTLIQMKYLDEENSWNLLHINVFGQGKCPTELEGVGRKIATNCKGLPLAIVVIGGLLAKSKTLEHWKHIAKDFSSSIYLNDEEHCLNILSLSYNHLPVHLKPCFLYLGAFPEDCRIKVSRLTRLWVAEGFLKCIRGKTCDEVAEQYLNDLVERNLLMVHEWTRLTGKIKYCIMHDVLRVLCLREAQKENFLHVVNAQSLGIPPSLKCPRCIVIQLMDSELEKCPQMFDSWHFTTFPRSLITYCKGVLPMVLGSPIFWLLRALSVMTMSYTTMDFRLLRDVILKLLNLRYLCSETFSAGKYDEIFAPCLRLFRNLQTVAIKDYHGREASFDIWNLSELRHIKFDMFILSEPPSSYQQEHECTILDNLRSLIPLKNFRISEEVLKRISNIQRLELVYFDEAMKNWSHYCTQNLGNLQRLECLYFHFPLEFQRPLVQNFALPQSLKVLQLSASTISEDMTVIGSLPNLEVLALSGGGFIGSTWDPIEGEFCRLKSLHMYSIHLTDWNADSSHFPCLEQLIIKYVSLKEIPMDIGEIPTLQFIYLEGCLYSAIISAKNILDEQQSFGNDELVVKVLNEEMIPKESLAGKNFFLAAN